MPAGFTAVPAAENLQAIALLVIKGRGPCHYEAMGALVHFGAERFAGILVVFSTAGCSSSNVSLGGTPTCAQPPGLTTLASGGEPQADIAVDGTSAYWVDVLPPVKGEMRWPIVKAPLDGGAVTTLASPSAANAIAVDATSVYWGYGEIVKMDKNGGTPITLVSTTDEVMRLAVDSTSVYWSTEPWMTLPYQGPTGTVMKVDKTGSSPITLASEQGSISGLTVDATNVYYGKSLSDGMLSNGVATVYPGAVVSVPLGGGTPRTLASGQFYLDSIVSDGSYVYYGTETELGNGRPGTLMRVPLAGGNPTTIASEPDPITALAVDGANVYWGAVGAYGQAPVGILKSMPVAGGAVTVPAPCQFPAAIAVNDKSLCWINGIVDSANSGSVMCLTPK